MSRIRSQEPLSKQISVDGVDELQLQKAIRPKKEFQGDTSSVPDHWKPTPNSKCCVGYKRRKAARR